MVNIVEKLKELFKNKKVVIATVVLITLIGIFGFRKYQEKVKEERLASAMEMLDLTYNDEDEDLFEFERIEGRTDLIIEIDEWEMDKDEMLNDVTYYSFFDTTWRTIIDLDKKTNKNLNEKMTEEGYKDIKVLSYEIDENGEVIAIIYDGTVYYDYLKDIDRHEKLEDKFDIEIELEELE